MKIGILSDIHVDINYQEDDTIEEALIDVIRNSPLDAMIVAGDIANKYQTSLRVIDTIEDRTGIRCMFVPGNHDLWNMENPHITNTCEIVDIFSKHKSCLIGSPVVLNEEYVVIGDTGWYDYTFGQNRFTPEQFAAGFYNERQWKDKEYVNWNMTDIEKTEKSVASLKKQTDAYPGKKIIFVTHMLTHEAFTVPLPNAIWEYFNAFLGSVQYQSIFNENVKHVIMGHVHYRKNVYENGIHYYCRCLNYRKEWESEKAVNEIENAMDIVSI